jgi:hypothetical protein
MLPCLVSDEASTTHPPVSRGSAPTARSANRTSWTSATDIGT